ncbi:MAG TPA: glycosyl hydrolase [Gaiellaceae bacterium]
MGDRKTWLAAASVLAVFMSIFATGSSAAKTKGSAPVNTAPPIVSGTPVVGGTVTGDRGTWTGTGNTYAYQWLRCDSAGAACAPIGGATATSHAVTASDVGSTLRFSVVVSSRKASTSATSAASAVVTTQSTTPTSNPQPSTSRIYWGAWIEGKQTYSYLYGGTWGNAPWSTQTWTKYDQNAGKKPSIIHWGAGTFWDHPFSYWANVLGLVQNAGALNLIDMDTGSVSLASIASGGEDAAIKAWALAAKAYGHPFFLRLNWEMNGGWFPWGTTSSTNNSPADFVAAWRHIHDIFAAQGATNATWVWCPNTEWSNSVPYSQLYPGDAYVGWTCLDGYNTGSSSQSFSSIYSQSYDDLLKVAPNKPVMIGEVASLEYGAGVKANWITNMLDVLPKSFPQIKALVWFNWRNDHNGTWEGNEIESSASSQAAFAGGIASPYYAAASSFSIPASLTQIQPLP